MSSGSDSQQEPQPQQEQQSRSRAPPQPHKLQATARQWVPMQYPVIMQHPMIAPPPQHYGPIPPPQHYMAYHHRYFQQLHHPHVQHHQKKQQVSNNGENKTIWVGDLLQWMDEAYLRSSFASTNEIASIKVIRNRHTGFSEGYGFVEFHSHAAAEKVLQSYPKLVMPNTDQFFRLNWASFSSGDKRSDNGSDHSIFVGDLAADVTDSLLHETFVSKYQSVKAAKVVIDVNTGRSKGYGFVRFGDENERSKAMTEMNGTFCSSRPMRIGPATPRKASGYQQYSPQGGYASNGVPNRDGDATNTTIFVGGLDSSVTDEDLRQPFSEYGEIFSVKIPAGKGCGFVQFVHRNNAEEALQKLNGTAIGKQTVRLSWGRSPANKQFIADYGSPYYGGQFYEGYGYGFAPPHDPAMYAAAYGPYPVYGSHQQPVN